MHVVLQPIALVHYFLTQIDQPTFALEHVALEFSLVDVSVSEAQHSSRFFGTLIEVPFKDHAVAPGFDTVAVHQVFLPIAFVCVHYCVLVLSR